MCGRYTLTIKPDVIATHFRLSHTPEFTPRFNIAPSQDVPVVRMDVDGPRLDMLRWGYIPSWAKSPALGAKMINARSESAGVKVAFRSALRERRCLIPADGFYEWRRKGLTRQPFYIRRRDDRLFAFAGLWTAWLGPTGEFIESCAILTTEPNEMLRQIHDRMPVIMDERGYDVWLSTEETDPRRLIHLLMPTPTDNLVMHPVSAHVNDPHIDDPECVVPIELAPDPQESLF